jgi:hypothetical protein
VQDPFASNVVNHELPVGSTQPPEVEPTLDRIMRESLIGLAAETPMGIIVGLLEKLRSSMHGLTGLEQALLRDRVTKLLKDTRMQRPAAIVDEALDHLPQKSEPDSKELFPSIAPWPEPVDGPCCWTAWSRSSCAT